MEGGWEQGDIWKVKARMMGKMLIDHSRRIFHTTLMKGHTYWADLSIISV